MKDDPYNNRPHSNGPQRPSPRMLGRYDSLRETEQQTLPKPSSQSALFTMNITATRTEGETMDSEQNFVINLIFKPEAPHLKLRPEETQLLLAYMGEILKEIEDEERAIITKVTSVTQQGGGSSCK